MSDSTPPTTSAVDEKTSHAEHAERIATHDRVPGHDNYYEKNGLRTYGDGEDHDHEPPVGLTNSTQEPSLTQITALLPSIDVLDSHGISLDWIPNSRVHFRFVYIPTP